MESHPELKEERPSNIPCDKLTLFVVKASPTSTVNSLKPLLLIEELEIPHSVYVVGSPGKEPWFSRVNPAQMIPALEDFASRNKKEEDPKAGDRVQIWESTSCLTFLVDKYDSEGLFSGRNLYERTQVGNWMALHTSSLGQVSIATAKWWLWFKTLHPETIGTTLDKLSDSIRHQYTLLDNRLSEPKQEYIALTDRPTVADLVNLPFANEQIAATAGYDFNDWPHLKSWSLRMFARPAVQRALARVQKFGIEEEIGN